MINLNDLYFSSISVMSTKGSFWTACVIASREDLFRPRSESQYLCAASCLICISDDEGGVLGGVGFEIGTKENILEGWDVGAS